MSWRGHRRHNQLARCGLQIASCGSTIIIIATVITIEHREWHILIRMTVVIIVRTLWCRRSIRISLISIARVLACGGK